MSKHPLWYLQIGHQQCAGCIVRAGCQVSISVLNQTPCQSRAAGLLCCQAGRFRAGQMAQEPREGQNGLHPASAGSLDGVYLEWRYREQGSL